MVNIAALVYLLATVIVTIHNIAHDCPDCEGLIHSPTQSDDPISCNGEPVERTNEIACLHEIP